MRAALCLVTKNSLRNTRLHKALKAGLRVHGDELIYYPQPEINCMPAPTENVRFIVGNRDTKQIDDGIHRFVFDKGYDRKHISESEWLHWSIRHMPSWPESRLLVDAPHDRIDTLSVELEERKTTGDIITVALSSQKYCTQHHLGDARKYAENLIAEIKKITNRPIVYRPKPSYHDAGPIKGTKFNHSKGSSVMRRIMNSSHVLITEGSHISSRAVIAGVPAISLDGGMAYSVTGKTLDNLEEPYWPDEKKRKNWFADIGYSHYTIPEIASGLAWEVMKQRI